MSVRMDDSDYDITSVWRTWAVATHIRSSTRTHMNKNRDDDDDDNKPVWPTWAVGALFRGARRIHINHVCAHIPPPPGIEAYLQYPLFHVISKLHESKTLCSTPRNSSRHRKISEHA